MLDDIYPRLLLEIIPEELKLNSLGSQRLISEHNADHDSNAVYGKLIKSIYTAQPNSNIGIKYGQLLSPSNLCDFSRLLITSQNLRSAFDILENTFFIHGASYYPFISSRKGVTSVSFTFPFKTHVPSPQRRFCAEATFSYIVNAIQETAAPNFKPLKVYFDYEQPSYAQDYHASFGENIQFNAPLCLLEFDEKHLYPTFKSHNIALHKMYLNKCLDNSRVTERQHSFEYKAACFLLQHHPESFTSKKLATMLNISVRGLQKKLNKQELSFSHIANLARRELAKIYLFQKRQSIDYTAEQLGFQTSSGFRRFFKTEFEMSPAEYLKSAGIENNGL
jgi:AraC-like DNA-binding protein